VNTTKAHIKAPEANILHKTTQGGEAWINVVCEE